MRNHGYDNQYIENCACCPGSGSIYWKEGPERSKEIPIESSDSEEVDNYSEEVDNYSEEVDDCDIYLEKKVETVRVGKDTDWVDYLRKGLPPYFRKVEITEYDRLKIGYHDF